MQTRLVPLTVLLLASLLIAAAPHPTTAPTRQYVQVSILAQWTSDVEQSDFQAVLLPFFQKYNVQPNLIAAANLQETLDQQIDAGTPPDIVLMSQPGLLRDVVASGQVIDLGAALGSPPAGYPRFLADQVTVGGREYGRFVRLEAKALVWANVPATFGGEYGLPSTWDDLIALSNRIRADGRTPWALGLDDAGIGTDIIETILLQQHGAALVDGLADGSVRWTDERVRAAWSQFGALLDTGLTDDPANLSPVEAALALFANPPEAMFSAGPSTALRWITDAQPALMPVEDVIYFPLPADGDMNRVIIGGDFLILLNDDPVTLQLAAFLTSTDTAEAWAATGSAISPFPNADYPNEVLDAAAALVHEGDPAFDLSARLSPDVRAAFDAGVLRYAADRGALDDVLRNIDAAAR